MGRGIDKSDTTVISIRLLKAIDNRLETWSKAHGWSKTKTIEYAVDNWLAAREMELQSHGLAEVKH